MNNLTDLLFDKLVLPASCYTTLIMIVVLIIDFLRNARCRLAAKAFAIFRELPVKAQLRSFLPLVFVPLSAIWLASIAESGNLTAVVFEITIILLTFLFSAQSAAYRSFKPDSIVLALVLTLMAAVIVYLRHSVDENNLKQVYLIVAAFPLAFSMANVFALITVRGSVSHASAERRDDAPEVF